MRSVNRYRAIGVWIDEADQGSIPAAFLTIPVFGWSLVTVDPISCFHVEDVQDDRHPRRDVQLLDARLRSPACETRGTRGRGRRAAGSLSPAAGSGQTGSFNGWSE